MKYQGKKYFDIENDRWEHIPSITNSYEDISRYVLQCIEEDFRHIKYTELVDIVFDIWEETLVTKNASILGYFKEQSETYKREGDKYRGLAFEKAYKTLHELRVPLLSYKQAVKLPNIGKGIATRLQDKFF